MSVYTQQKILPYTAAQAFSIVANIEHYPVFIPWVMETTILAQTPQQLKASLVVGHALLHETYTSHVMLTPPHSIEATCFDEPLRYLVNRWSFKPVGTSQVAVKFYVAFEFRSFFLQKLMQITLPHASRQIMLAFEKRAQALSQLKQNIG